MLLPALGLLVVLALTPSASACHGSVPTPGLSVCTTPATCPPGTTCCMIDPCLPNDSPPLQVLPLVGWAGTNAASCATGMGGQLSNTLVPPAVWTAEFAVETVTGC